MRIARPSLHLPALLGAVAALCEQAPLRNTMATGAFDEPLGSLQAKIEVFRSRRAFLGLERLLIASAPRIGQSGRNAQPVPHRGPVVAVTVTEPATSATSPG